MEKSFLRVGPRFWHLRPALAGALVRAPIDLSDPSTEYRVLWNAIQRTRRFPPPVCRVRRSPTNETKKKNPNQKPHRQQNKQNASTNVGRRWGGGGGGGSRLEAGKRNDNGRVFFFVGCCTGCCGCCTCRRCSCGLRAHGQPGQTRSTSPEPYFKTR